MLDYSGILMAERVTLAVLEGGKTCHCCLPRPRVSALRFPVNIQEMLTWDYSSALVQAKDSNGKSIFAGRKFTGFTNAEEEAGGLPVEVGRRARAS